MTQKSYALRTPEGMWWRFMTSLDEWEANARGEPAQLWQSDTPVSLTLEEAEMVQEHNVQDVGNDPFDIVEIEGPPTHRLSQEQPDLSHRQFWPQIERIQYSCPHTIALFDTKEAA